MGVWSSGPCIGLAFSILPVAQLALATAVVIISCKHLRNQELEWRPSPNAPIISITVKCLWAGNFNDSAVCNYTIAAYAVSAAAAFAAILLWVVATLSGLSAARGGEVSAAMGHIHIALCCGTLSPLLVFALWLALAALYTSNGQDADAEGLPGEDERHTCLGLAWAVVGLAALDIALAGVRLCVPKLTRSLYYVGAGKDHGSGAGPAQD